MRISGGNYGSVEGSFSISGGNHGSVKGSGSISGGNHGSVKGSFSISGGNYKSARGPIIRVTGSNAQGAEIIAFQEADVDQNSGYIEAPQVSLRMNLIGGRVLAQEKLIFCELELTAGLLRMKKGAITHEFVVGIVNGKQLTETVTVTPAGSGWLVDCQGVTNKLTLVDGNMLLLEHLFGEPRDNVVIGDVVFGGGSVIRGSSITMIGGNGNVGMVTYVGGNSSNAQADARRAQADARRTGWASTEAGQRTFNDFLSSFGDF